MTRTIVVTGAGSGIGRATVVELEVAGHRVIGVDLRNAEVIADLSAAEGRSAMVRRVAELAPDGIDGVVAAAGISIGFDVPTMVAVNYFGAVATLELLRPLLLCSRTPCAVVVTSAAALQDYDDGLMNACLSGDEAAALELASSFDPMANGYPSTKQALARWMRAAAVSKDWAGSGILLNGIAPGVVLTTMTKPFFATEKGRAMMASVSPTALADRHHGEASELAEAIAFLATLRGRFLLGQIIYVDGGTEAMARPDAI